MVPRLGPVGGDIKALVAGRNQFYRPSQPARNAGDDGRARRHRSLGAEGATDIGIDHPHPVGVDAELRGDAVFQAMHILARLVDDQAVTVPDATGGEQLHRIVVLGRRFVLGVDLHRGLAKGLGKIADFRVVFKPRKLAFGGRRGGSRGVERGGRSGRSVAYFHQMRGFARGLIGVCQHYTDDLAFLGDFIRLQRLVGGRGIAARAKGFHLFQLLCIFVGDDIDHVTNFPGLAKIETIDSSFRDRAGDEIGMDRIDQLHVGGILRLAGDFGHRVVTRDRLPHIGFRFGRGDGHAQTSIVTA